MYGGGESHHSDYSYPFCAHLLRVFMLGGRSVVAEGWGGVAPVIPSLGLICSGRSSEG